MKVAHTLILLIFMSNISLAQLNGSVLRQMEGTWQLDTSTYEATYEPARTFPPMRMECAMTLAENGLFCNIYIPDDTGRYSRISTEYYAYQAETGKLLIITTMNETADVSYGEIRDENRLGFFYEENDTIVFESEYRFEKDKFIMHSILSGLQGLNGTSTMTFFRQD